MEQIELEQCETPETLELGGVVWTRVPLKLEDWKGVDGESGRRLWVSRYEGGNSFYWQCQFTDFEIQNGLVKNDLSGIVEGREAALREALAAAKIPLTKYLHGLVEKMMELGLLTADENYKRGYAAGQADLKAAILALPAAA